MQSLFLACFSFYRFEEVVLDFYRGAALKFACLKIMSSFSVKLS
jgi:hypothetical protein